MMKIVLACLTLPVVLAACAAPSADSLSSAHITPQQCQDLAALKAGAAPTHQRLTSEVAVLLTADYNPVTEADTYPGSFHHAQRRVDYWYANDCRNVRLE
jgi:hypothetical protein